MDPNLNSPIDVFIAHGPHRESVAIISFFGCLAKGTAPLYYHASGFFQHAVDPF